jgi:cytochrome c
MAGPSRIQPSLWVAIGLVGFVFCGGAISTGVQAWQSRSERRAAAAEMTQGDATAGKAIIKRVSCGACHAIPGIDRADGTVGPSLDKVATRAFLAGRLANTPVNLIQWIRRPQAVEPGNGMPDPPITDQEARDVAAYLYTLK